MDIPEILVYVLIAITFLYLAWILLRDRGRAKARRDLLLRTADPDRGGGPFAHEADAREE